MGYDLNSDFWFVLGLFILGIALGRLFGMLVTPLVKKIFKKNRYKWMANKKDR